MLLIFLATMELEPKLKERLLKRQFSEKGPHTAKNINKLWIS